MRGYGIVAPQFWIGETGRVLRRAGSEAQLVALYLVSNPHANMLGLYYLPLAFIAHETALDEEGASKGLRRAIEGGFCQYDEDSEQVWVPEMARYQVGEALEVKDHRHKAVVKALGEWRNSPFYADFWDRYSGPFVLPEELKPKGLRRGLQGASKGLSRAKQEQEQEQEQEKDLPPPSCSEATLPRVCAHEKRPAAGEGLKEAAEIWEEHKQRTLRLDEIQTVQALLRRFGPAKAAEAVQAAVDEGAEYLSRAEMAAAGPIKRPLARGPPATHAGAADDWVSPEIPDWTTEDEHA